jgi:hypothetical protein
MEHVIVGLLAAVFGALAHWFLPALRDWIHIRNLSSALTGEWTSNYQGMDEPEGTWVQETVDFHVPFLSSKVVLKNKGSSNGYCYTGWGLLVRGIHIVGDWESIRPGANAYGAFMLTTSAQGEIIYGYYVGIDLAGSRRYGRWVLVREKSKLPAAKQLLQDMRQPRSAIQTENA